MGPNQKLAKQGQTNSNPKMYWETIGILIFLNNYQELPNSFVQRLEHTIYMLELQECQINISILYQPI